MESPTSNARYESRIDDDILKYWLDVGEMKNVISEFIFKDLSQFAIVTLSPSISNAVVEQVFSVKNTIKTKLRNKMKF